MTIMQGRVIPRAGVLLVVAATLAACSSTGQAPAPTSSGDPTDATTAVHITVGDLPTTDNPEQRKAMLDTVEAFEAANPGVTVEATETHYDTQTFAAQLAGGTLPTSLTIPFTDIQGLAANEQVKDLSSYFDTDDTLKALSPSALAAAKDANGAYWGVPISAYTLALMVNRKVLTEAGLDPDTVDLSTWDAVAKAAQTIGEKTDAGGIAYLSKDNQGGWITAGLSYSFGGAYEAKGADGTWTATLTDPNVVEAVQFLKDLRWKYNGVGANYTLSFDDAGPAFASGQYGMIIGDPGWYGAFTQSSGMDKNDFGAYPTPETADGLGNLGGGTLAVVTAGASDAETAAALEWIKYYDLRSRTDPTVAAETAKTKNADGSPVPSVGLPITGPELWQKYLEAVEPYINVPLDNIKPYQDATASSDYTIVSEPPVEAQKVYALVDTVVQAVFTDQNADPAALLETAQNQAAPIVAAAQQ